MLKRFLPFLLLSVLVLNVVACGGQQAATGGGATGNVENGKALYSKSPLGTNKLASCVSCHSLEKGRTIVGPSLAAIGTDAAKRIKEADYTGAAKTGAEYVREAIVDPNVYVVKGFGKGIMPAGYKDGLSQQEMDDLVAYLLTLK